ncbi:hypothetical protein CRYUN_Cryun35bG0085600 [Craigia yunnanensis]
MMQKAMMGRTLLSISLLSSTKHFSRYPFLKLPKPSRVLPGFKPLCTASTLIPTTIEPDELKHSMLLERLRMRHLKESTKTPSPSRPREKLAAFDKESEASDKGKRKKKGMVDSFEELGLSEEVMGAVREMGIEVPTEIQCIGIPSVLGEKVWFWVLILALARLLLICCHLLRGSVVPCTFAFYVQLLRRDEAMLGMLTKPRRPRAVVLCPTRELSEQVFRVAKSISHHARFRSTMVSGGGRLRPQEDSLNNPIDMVVGTPGRVLQHIEDGNMVYGDIKYLVLDEADTMFDRGFGPDIRKFLGPLKNRALNPMAKDFKLF